MILIKLYDAREPVHNVISLTAFRPDTFVLLVRGARTMNVARRRMERFIASCGLQIKTRFIQCDGSSLAEVEYCLESLLQQYGTENCVIDVKGGDELMLLAAGSCTKGEKGIRIVSGKRRSEAFLWLKGDALETQRKPVWSLEQLIALGGGELVRNARASQALTQVSFFDLIPDVFGVYLKYRASWPEFALYMQRLNQPEYCEGDSLCYRAPKLFYVGRRRVDPPGNIFADLLRAGALTELSETDEMYRMTFSSDAMLKYLCDVGAWLELFGYYMLKKSGMFNEVQMSAVISWDDDADNRDVINEIDLVALDGTAQLFISCKTALPDNMVLHEIATLTERFGSDWAIPVLITASNLEKEAPAVYRRAAEMGIAVFDVDDLQEKRFIDKLVALRNRWHHSKERNEAIWT